jgi:hypothetical protein
MDAKGWNGLLFEAVFASKHDRKPIRIINATDGFLAHVAGFAEDEATAAREDFVNAFRKVPYNARRLLDYEFQMLDWRKSGTRHPTFFGQLYLSLLAASATEDTYDEGDFRRRYSQLLHLPEGNYVSYGLPRLWRELARWLEAEFHAGRPVRRLKLPDPGSETIIGYSKRLAFPGFSELRRLAALLSEHALSSESPVQAILDVLGSRQSAFSESFREEYAHFRRALESDPDGVFLLPLWAAIEAASFEPTFRAASLRAKFALLLEFDDFGRPQAYLFSDRQPSSATSSHLCVSRIQPAILGCDRRLEPKSTESCGSIFRELLGASSAILRVLQGSGILRQAQQGCLVFAPDEDTPRLWRASLPRSGPCCFVCNEAARSILMRTPSLHAEPTVSIEGVHGWTLVEVRDSRPLAERASSLAESSRFDALCPGVTSPRLTLRGGVRLPDGVLLSTASRPEVIAVGCDSVTMRVAYEAGSSTAMGALEPVADSAGFTPTLKQIRELRLPASIILSGMMGQESVASRQFIASSSVSGQMLSSSPDEASYLEESAIGQLTAPNAPASVDSEWSVNPFADLLEARLRTTPFQQGRDSPTTVAENAISRDLWEDVYEALYGAFSNAQSLPYDRVAELTETLRTHMPRISLVDPPLLLCHHLKVRILWHRRWQGVRYFPVVPYLHSDPETGSIRLLGLTTRALRRRFSEEVGERLVVPTGMTGISPPRALSAAKFDSSEAARIAARLGLPLRLSDHTRLLELREIADRLSGRFRRNLTAGDTKFWSEPLSAFTASHDVTETTFLQRRDFERSQSMYEIVDAGEVIWATESRAWATLLYRLSCGRPAFLVDRAAILSDYPLPLPFGIAASHSGGGLELALSGRSAVWRYRFGAQSALERFLEPWAPQHLSPTTSVTRWAMGIESSSSMTMAKRLAFRRRYARCKHA